MADDLRVMILQYEFRKGKRTEILGKIEVTNQKRKIITANNIEIGEVVHRDNRLGRDEALFTIRRGFVKSATPEGIPVTRFFDIQLRRYGGLLLISEGPALDLYRGKDAMPNEYIGTIRLLYEAEQ